MKRFVSIILFSIVFIGVVFSNPTDEQIRQAATTLGVPFDDLRRFVRSYQNRNTPEGTIEISANQLSQEFRNNQLRASSQYMDKTLQISGQLSKIERNYRNEYYLVIVGSSALYTVEVYLQPSELNKIANLNLGQNIIIVGKCEEYTGYDVKIGNAYIVR